MYFKNYQKKKFPSYSSYQFVNVQTYNAEDDVWERVGNLPRGLAGLRLCTLTLPHHLIR